MKTIWLTNCHLCSAKKQVVTGRSSEESLRSHCTACGHSWPSYSDYMEEHKASNGGLGPFPQEVCIPLDCIGMDEDYPGSEEMKIAIYDLIYEVEKKFFNKLRDDLDKLCYGRDTGDANYMMWVHLNKTWDEYNRDD